jgi:hypothetical protein
MKARPPALDKLMKDARRHKFDVLMVWSIDRLARSTKHLLQTLDELNGMGIQFMSQREAIDSEGPLARAIIAIVSAMAELERCIIIERAWAEMRRAKLEGRQIGRSRLWAIHRVNRRAERGYTRRKSSFGISRALCNKLGPIRTWVNSADQTSTEEIETSLPALADRRLRLVRRQLQFRAMSHLGARILRPCHDSRSRSHRRN